MISPRTNLVMAVIGFSLSILFIAFVCTRLIWARIRMSALRRSLAGASRSDLSISERGHRGFQPLALANFPTKKYKELCSSSKENACQRCIVCLSDYHDEDTLSILPVCGHSFHATCISIWLRQQSTCPVCRTSFRDLPNRKWFMQPIFSPPLRSQHRMQPVNARYCHCMGNGNRHSFRPDSHEIVCPVQEIRCSSEGDAVRVGDGQSIPIDREKINSKVESASN